MNYTKTSLCNLALNRIGARGQIVNIDTENSPNAIKCLNVFDAVFAEVSSERDWKTMKTRQPLALSPVTPLYTYRYAWALPQDFLRFVRPRRRQESRDQQWMNGPDCVGGWYSRHDPPFWPQGFDYKVETLTAGWKITQSGGNTVAVPYPDPFPTGKYCLTNYGGGSNPNQTNPGPPTPAAITYIRLITDYTQLMPGFVNCLAYRLAKELCIGVTEDKNKWQLMDEQYKEALNSSEAQNETMDTNHDEDGSDSWVMAGRYADNYGGWRGQ